MHKNLHALPLNQKPLLSLLSIHERRALPFFNARLNIHQRNLPGLEPPDKIRLLPLRDNIRVDQPSIKKPRLLIVVEGLRRKLPDILHHPVLLVQKELLHVVVEHPLEQAPVEQGDVRVLGEGRGRQLLRVPDQHHLVRAVFKRDQRRGLRALLLIAENYLRRLVDYQRADRMLVAVELLAAGRGERAANNLRVLHHFGDVLDVGFLGLTKSRYFVLDFEELELLELVGDVAALVVELVELLDGLGLLLHVLDFVGEFHQLVQQLRLLVVAAQL